MNNPKHFAEYIIGQYGDFAIIHISDIISELQDVNKLVSHESPNVFNVLQWKIKYFWDVYDYIKISLTSN